MITNKRSDFFYTLNDDERKCLASIERAEQRIKRAALNNNHTYYSSKANPNDHGPSSKKEEQLATHQDFRESCSKNPS